MTGLSRTLAPDLVTLCYLGWVPRNAAFLKLVTVCYLDEKAPGTGSYA
jgi:hypothetical protein